MLRNTILKLFKTRRILVKAMTRFKATYFGYGIMFGIVAVLYMESREFFIKNQLAISKHNLSFEQIV